MGKHLSEVPDEDYVPYMKAFFASTILYSFAIYLVKISIMLQYCRIFQDTRFYRFYFYITIGLSCWTVLMCLLLPFICVPIQRFWNHDTPGTCLNILALWMAVSVINMVTDITCFIIPIPPLLTLRMPTRTKILLAFIFGLALCPCIISAYRITTLTATAHSTDSTWDNANTAMWSFLELSIGAIAACLPTYRPVLSTLMPRVFTPSSHSGNMRTDPPTHQQGFSLQTSHSNVRKSRYDTESTRGLGLVDANDHGYSTLEEEEAVSTRSVS
ncbi:hypothetical protein BKA67DRAFT_581484 [Truncatella angustata]|uniref:Rhodopsin domain-containing protein n=1 Tax=Truncatella angustata TaxID=152316 RepID=A0A9P8UC76_9PEZI|nr:uncharacterized protein BKA67DRAFT_581484 [Truncatella angustata]KAH6647042.1 hypothetical protein BKA67DRAFT_581484 [Truncatella angustata]